jgi:nucleosome binding factor SPN SPT16 subunit
MVANVQLLFALQENYNFLVALEEELLKVLTDGTALNAVYQAGIKYAEKEKPDLVANLTKNFGFATGIEFRESSLVIGPKTTALARKDMVFNVNVGLAGLTNKEASDKEGKVYALFIGDTVQVNVVSTE